MDEAELKSRTKQFALRVMRLVDALPKSIKGRTVAGQLIRSGTSVAANYRASCRARSRAEFISKLGVVVEEADESALWLEIIVEDELLPKARVEPLLAEACEIVRIMVASRKTAAGIRPSCNHQSKIVNRK